jgi:hypothetical protein
MQRSFESKGDRINHRVLGALLVRMANVGVAKSIAGSRPATRTEAAQKANGLGRARIGLRGAPPCQTATGAPLEKPG